MFAALLLALLPASTITGTIRTEGIHEPVASATVQIAELGRRVPADAHGYFVVPNVPAGTWRLRVTAPGFREMEREVRIPGAGAVRLDLELAPQPVEVAGIEVRSRSGSAAAAQTGPGGSRMDRALIHAAPALAEVDVLRALHTLPSVASASDFSSALYVRGGSPDQTLVLLDGVPLFNPYHLGGIFAAIDPDAVASVDLLAGALPARLGDRLSGVVDIRTRTGGRDHVRGSGSVGLLSSRAMVDGPLPGREGSYLFSVRRTYVDLFTDVVHRLGAIPGTVPYAFTDAHLKATHDVGRTGSVTASLYVDQEGVHVPPGMDVSEDAEWSWGSKAGSIRYLQPLGTALLGEFRVGFSSFGGTFIMMPQRRGRADRGGTGISGRDPLPRSLDARTSVRDLVAAADISWSYRTHHVRAGAQSDVYLFDYDVAVVHEELKDYFPTFQREDRPLTVAAYIEDEWRPGPAVELRAGVRVLSLEGRRTEWMPRLGGRLRVSPRLSLFAGGGRYAQVLHSIRDEESIFSSLMAYDFFAPVPGGLGLSAGYDAVGGLEWESGATLLRAEGYAKRLQRIPLSPLPAEPLLAPVLVPEGAEVGKGSAEGVELLARHGWADGGVSLSYALAFAERALGEERFTPRFERRHRLDVMGHTRVGSRGQAGGRVLWSTGQPYTPAVSETPGLVYDPKTGAFVPGSGSVVLGEHNSARLPGYFRLDLSARRSFDRTWFGRTTTLTPYLHVLNVLNTRNVLFAEPAPSAGDRRPELKFAPQLPILPTIGLEWRF